VLAKKGGGVVLDRDVKRCTGRVQVREPTFEVGEGRPPPIVYGYPSDETLRSAERGEITIGGCLPDLPVERACPTCELPAFSDGRPDGRPAVEGEGARSS
jgi:hypothetical protein